MTDQDAKMERLCNIDESYAHHNDMQKIATIAEEVIQSMLRRKMVQIL